jgi:hypothetical protein
MEGLTEWLHLWQQKPMVADQEIENEADLSVTGQILIHLVSAEAIFDLT